MAICKCGNRIQGSYPRCTSCQERYDKKQRNIYGIRKCNGCGARVSGNKKYCSMCYSKYVK